ncbi:hypothetical protein BSK62_13285 [Paenibacillus odorifer]|uniref:DnaD domain protein n=1 Tax=Paenibacillus odorifer TaxID=189426 RepID=UPI00096CCA84|nr:DnaD domain protein [Paenibacillus odorifer]OMD66035.1 hypothetical protein BSK62_13285 [Paenibacillus odorifer]
MDGWIKLHRKIIDSAIFSDPDILRLWIYCLAKAAYKETTVMFEKQEVNLLPGEFITGRFSLHSEYNSGVAPRKKIKDTTLWNWLKKLEKYGNIDIKTTNKYSVVSIVKWSEYQETLTTEQQQIDNRLTTDSQQIDTNKKLKNLENLKNISTTTSTSDSDNENLALGDIYTKIFGTFSMTGQMSEFFMKIRDRGMTEKFCIELLLEASESSTSSRPSMRYLETIRDRWIDENINSRQEAKERREGDKRGKYTGRNEGDRSGGNQKESEFAFLDYQNRTGA